MSRLFAACFLLVIASPAFADDKPKPKEKQKAHALTAKEIAEGRLMLFDGETTFGWKIEGEAAVKDGQLILGGTKATTATCTTAFPASQVWLGLEFASTLSDEKVPRLTLNSGAENIIPFSTPGELVGYPVSSELRTQVRFTVQPNTTLKIGTVHLDPAPREKLFAGKNLDGWKVNDADPKRKASKWDVTAEGEMSLKNGPGDLVTEKEFDNFVLQLECKTLGDSLNSGVFFRCIPGQYQNGYEAQIHNGFIDKDRTKPKDFGTGAIYRRVATRKVVANDKEWFTMTVVADGKHMATWVNGYQTVDWTDDRKENENPRNGYRAEKGPISLQGHDPTTDILFKNIRIAEMPK